MSLYRTTNGFGVDWRDQFGRRHRKFIGSEEAARRMDSDLHASGELARQALLNYRSSDAIDAHTAVDLYLANLAAGQVTKRYQCERLHHVATRLGNPPITQITPDLLTTYSNQRRQELAPSSLIKEHQLIRQLFAFLVSKWYLPSSPAEHLVATGPRRSAGRAITPAEELRILAACTEKIRTKILAALDAGLRLSECNRLRRNHLVSDEGLLKVWSTKSHSDRTIPLTPRLHVALEQLGARLAPDSLLFSRAGKQVKKGSDALKKIRPKARVAFRFHDLRHTFATRLAAVAKNPHIVRVLLGHAPRATTDLYVHPPLAELREAILLMAEANHAALCAAQEQTL